MTLPNWAKTLFIITEQGTDESYNTRNLTNGQIASLLDLFTAKKELLKKRCQNTPYPSNLSITTTEELASEYSVCNIGFALVELERLKRLPGNPEKKNLGTGSQHWIPECYMKAFSKDFGKKKPNFKVHKVAKRLDISLLEDGTQTRLIGIPTRINGSEFRENRAYKGTFYTPEFEKVLGCFETDYSNVRDIISLSKGEPSNLWEFIVLATFFSIFSLRTKERRELVASESEISAGLLTSLAPQLISTFPKRIARSEMHLIHRTRVLPEENQFIHYYKKNTPMRFPFTQNPFLIEKSAYGPSIWSIYNPNYLIWLKPKNLENKFSVKELSHDDVSSKDSFFFSNKLANIIQNSDFRHLYFHPDDTIWNILLEHNPDRRTEIVETGHIGSGPLSKKWSSSATINDYKFGSRRTYTCNNSEIILDTGYLVIKFQSVSIKQTIKLQFEIHNLAGNFMLSIISSRWQLDTWDVQPPNRSTPFYQNIYKHFNK